MTACWRRTSRRDTGLQLFAVLQRVVIVLPEILLIDVLVQIHHLEHDLGVDLG